MKLIRSAALYKEALEYLVGGVNSPVRAFKAVGGKPIFIKRGGGSKIFDVDGNQYIDYVMSWGALILGHANPLISKALKEALNSGTSFGAPTEKETQLCKIISKAISSMEMVRLLNSGTEAAMTAIRLARGFTGKDKIIKFSGAYHGHYDGFLVKAGSGGLTLGIPDSLGVPRSVSRDTIVLPYNDIDSLKRVIRQRHKEIACVIAEPVSANMGVVLPKPYFLADLRGLTKKYKIILIFDEVVTGFRLCYGGAQTLYGINPDLTCLGKIVGGGLPIGVLGGRKEIMKNLSPEGRVYQAGTLSGNPIAVSAGLATLKALSKLNYQKLNNRTEKLCIGIAEVLKKNNLSFPINRIGSMFTLFFTPQKYASYFWSMLKNGIYFAPSQFEANFLSFAHKEEDIKSTLAAYKKVFTR